jgi:hypothetical protein
MGRASTADQERVQYAVDMRQLFSPPGMILPDGSINQEFFKPKKVITVNERRWGDAERNGLYKGLEKHGVGKWREIGEEFLSGWDDHTIRLKAARLIGCQNLSWYMGKKLTTEQVDVEYSKNKALGEKTGCWKSGALVDNDKGVIKQHFLQLQGQQGLNGELAEEQEQPQQSLHQEAAADDDVR